MARTKEQVHTYATARGMRVTQHGVVLSELLSSPGPTHSVADVLAAVVEVLSPGPRVALLGFEAGGMIAPLRALGCGHRIEAVDLTCRSLRLFQAVSRTWRGEVQVHRGDAFEWVGEHPRAFDMVIEDLSVVEHDDVVKPSMSWGALPERIRAALKPEGVAVFNLLKPQHLTWKAGLARVSRHFDTARVVELETYENRLLLGARTLPSARAISLRLQRALRRLGSYLAPTLRVRTLQVTARTPKL